MKLLETIQLEDITPEDKESMAKRQTARAVLFDGDGKIALLHVARMGYHKLPGGGVEKGEDILAGLNRECMEETGCQVHVRDEVGRIVEYRKRFNLKQESYCYVAEVVGEKGTPKFEEDEIREGLELTWVDLASAIDIVGNESPDDYEGKFIVKREASFLRAAEKLLK